jgi:phosphoribosylamine--glycine ligase
MARMTSCTQGSEHMRVLGVGQSCDLGDIYLRLAARGHEVRVFAAELAEHGTMRGMLEHVADYRAQLDWIRAAGDDGVILFETASQGEEQDQLRRDGFFVVGGSAFGDRLENDRSAGMQVLAEAGLPTLRTHAFDSCDEASAFVRARPGRYVFKLHGADASSWRTYVGQAHDGSDMLALLAGQQRRLRDAGFVAPRFMLMEHVTGIEVGVGAYFDGQRFLSPACIDWEHKRFFPGDLGELTGEMGTVVSYRGSQRLFERSLAKLAPRLREGGYVGYINLNTIINEHGLWPLELTCRFGYPGAAILSALQLNGWDDLLLALRSGRGEFATLPGFALGVVLTVPPYPYRFGYEHISKGLPISFDPSLTAEERDALHFAEVAEVHGQLVTSGIVGFTMVVTGVGESVASARERAYAVARKVYVPNLRYRADIGCALIDGDEARLRALGWLT